MTFFALFDIMYRLSERAVSCGGLAQLVEHLPCKQGVSGSIPLTSTTIRNISDDELGVCRCRFDVAPLRGVTAMECSSAG